MLFFLCSAGSSEEDSSDDESVEALPVVKKVARPQGRCAFESALSYVSGVSVSQLGSS